MKRWLIRMLSIILVTAVFLAPVSTYKAEAFTQEARLAQAKEELVQLALEKEILALVYLTDRYQVRSAGRIDSDIVAEVASGQSVMIHDVEVDAESKVWLKVSFYIGETNYSGYIEREYLACPDELFLQWEEEYGFYAQSEALMTTGDAGVSADIAQFPESYQSALLALKETYPNWVFVKMDVGIDWEKVVDVELNGAKGEYSLIPSTRDPFLQLKPYSSGWAYATKGALEYYLDPRNALTENSIFQFELLSFNSSYHEGCEAALQSFLNNTFMRGNVPLTTMSYAHVFWAIGRETRISPFHLASRVYQEQGQGTSPLISGTYPGYEGYYNYYNFKASGSTNKEVIENGLKYAKEKNWNSPYMALYGGSKLLGSSYINQGQDTLYLQKFDVEAIATNTLIRQYMQNICAPTSEARSIQKLYMNVGALNNVFVFKIPVYKNMPESCPLPVRKFADADRDAWYYSAVEYVYDKGIMQGVGSDQSGLAIFNPMQEIPREQFVTTLYALAGKPQVTAGKTFKDMEAGAYYEKPVWWAESKGIVSGYPDDTFGVGKFITREEIAAILKKYAESNSYDTSGRASIETYPDVAQVNSWAKDAMSWAVYTGMISGKPGENGEGNILAPGGNATRAECAAMLRKFINTYKGD